MKDPDILRLVATAITAAISATTFAFLQFEPKDDARLKKEAIEKRLDRIEEKIDRLIFKVK